MLLLDSCSRQVYDPPPPCIEVQTPPAASSRGYPNENAIRKNNIIITLDAGHGGEDFGAHSNIGPIYHEKNLNLAITKMLKQFLDRQGFTTVMTRMSDDFISLDKRAEYANNQNSDLFISLHFNSAPSKEADGIEVFYYRTSQNKERSDQSSLLAKLVLDKIIETTQAKSRGIKHGNFAVIRETNMPAILVESGFLTNDDEMQKIKDPAYLKKIAWGVSLGIQEYLKNNKPR